MAPPINIDQAHAIDLGTLTGGDPVTVTQDIRDAGVNYTVWYVYTSTADDNVLGVWAFGDLNPSGPSYRAALKVYDALGSVLWDLSVPNTPGQFPVTSGDTYWFRIAPATPPTPGDGASTLTLTLRRHLDEFCPVGSILINEDSNGFPATILSATDGHVLRFLPPVPAAATRSPVRAGEKLEILHATGQIVLSSSYTSDAGLYDSQLLNPVTIGFNCDHGFITDNKSSRFYVGKPNNPVSPFHAQVRAMDLAGTLGTTWTLPSIGLGYGAVNSTDTILYHNGQVSTGDATIRRWDLINSVALSILVADVVGYEVFGLFTLSDDTVLVGYFKSPATPSPDMFLRHYATDGTTLLTISVTVGSFAALPRLCLSVDDLTSCWLWRENSDISLSRFTQFQISDGATLTEFDASVFEAGTMVATATATPAAYFGHSSSCHLATIGITVPIIDPITGTIAVTLPTSGSSGSSTDVPLGLGLTGYVLPPRHLERLCYVAMTTAALSPDARQRVFSDLGVILPGAKLYTYVAGSSSTPLATYNDSALTIANPNPLVASAGGLLGPIYLLAQAYHFVLRTSAGALVFDQDNVWDVGELLESTLTAATAAIAAISAATETKFCTTQFNAVTGTTGATLTNIVGLTGFTLAAAGTYQYDVNISGVSTVNCGLKIGFGLTTATLTSLEALSEGFTASAVAVQHTTTATTGMTLFGQTAAVIGVRISGRIVVNAAGTLAVQAAQNAAHVDTTSVYVGSWARFVKVS